MAFWHGLYPGFILDLHYEELVQDTETQMQRVTSFCGLNADLPPLNARPRQQIVATPSAVQVRERVHADSIGRWRPYGAQLAPLAQLLGVSTAPTSKDG